MLEPPLAANTTKIHIKLDLIWLARKSQTVSTIWIFKDHSIQVKTIETHVFAFLSLIFDRELPEWSFLKCYFFKSEPLIS